MMNYLVESEAGAVLAEVEATRDEAVAIALVHANILGARVALIGEGTPVWIGPTTWDAHRTR